MKPGLHPDYRPVVFRDRSANFAFLTRSTVRTTRTIEWEDGLSWGEGWWKKRRLPTLRVPCVVLTVRSLIQKGHPCSAPCSAGRSTGPP